MFLATIFMLLSLLTFGLTVIGFIKPSIVLKNKEMKGKRLKIGASGMLSCFILLILSAIFAPEQDIHPEEENKKQQQASTQTASQEQAKNQPKEQPKEQAQAASSGNKTENTGVKIYKSAAKCIEDTGKFSIEDGTLKVISPNEFVLIRKMLPVNAPQAFDDLFMSDIVFMLLDTFAHTKLDELTLHFKTEYVKSPYIKPEKNLPDLSLYKITVHAKRQDVIAFLKANYQIYSFDELTDDNDKFNGTPKNPLDGTLPSDKFEKIYYGSGKDGEKKAWALINTFRVK